LRLAEQQRGTTRTYKRRVARHGPSRIRFLRLHQPASRSWILRTAVER